MRKAIASIMVLFLLFAAAAPVFAVEKEEDPSNMELKAPSAILVEAKTGTVLFSKAPHDKRPIASVTKIMTMLLAMEAIDRGDMSMNDTITVSEHAKSMGGSTIYLETGEQMSVHDVLKGIAVMSANDGCVAMGEHIAGSEEAFIKLMNDRAKELGMNDTHFSTTNGLVDEDNYSSANDVSLMSRELLLKHPKIKEFTTIWMDSLRGGAFQLANTNKLVKYYQGATGLKTGFTQKAMYCISASAKRGNMEYISVILGAPTSKDRFADASKLLNYGFNGFIIKDGVKAGEKIANVALQNGLIDHVLGISGKEFNMLVKKTDKSTLTYEINLKENLSAPIKKGDKIGDMAFFLDKKQVGDVEIVADQTVEKQNFFHLYMKIVKYWVNDKI